MVGKYEKMSDNYEKNARFQKEIQFRAFFAVIKISIELPFSRQRPAGGSIEMFPGMAYGKGSKLNFLSKRIICFAFSHVWYCW